MVDPESEWEIQESSGAENVEGKLGWVLRLGRKILVTGIVISSAPLVLPPLMAISAIGLVCSVPYGIVLMSYACTQTVMRRLLPMPSPASPLFLEYSQAFNGEEEANGDERNQGGQNEVIIGGISVEREEEELKEDTFEEVDKEKGELNKGTIWREVAYQKAGVENDEKKSMGEVDEIVEEIVCEEDDIVVVRDRKHRSNIENETSREAENVKEKEELVRETGQNAENVDAQRKAKKKKRRKKGKGKQSIKESVNERPGDEIHGCFTIVESDKKERDIVNKQTTAELKNVAVHVENDELVRESSRSLERNREMDRSSDAAEEKQGVEKAQADAIAKVKLLKGNEGTTEVKEEQYIRDESMSEQSMEEVIVIEFEGDEKNGSTIEKETPFQIKKVDVQLSQSIDIEEDEELVRETRGLLEKIRDEGKTDHAVADKWITKKEHVSAEKDDKKNAENVEKAKTRCIFAHDRMEQPTREFETKVEENKADNRVKMNEFVENKGKDAEGLSEEIDVDNIHRRAQPVGPVRETVNHGSSAKDLTVESAILVEGGNAADDNENNVEQSYTLEKDKKDVIFSNEDEEQGLDLLEDLSTVIQWGSPSDVNTFEESQPSSSDLVHQEISDSSELPVSMKAQESDDIRISGENAIDTDSNEAAYREKIWEQIDALRTIVGYKAERQETCVEELKAMYLFTGIEPPASFKDISNLAEVDAKLRFLKSVIGVK